MEILEKIKSLREANDLSQEKMAELMNMSKNSYGKLERGEVEITVRKLKKIASIFNVEISELINEKSVFCYIGDNSNYASNSTSHYSVVSDEMVKEIIQSKNEMIEQLKKEIELLKKLLAMYENNKNTPN